MTEQPPATAPQPPVPRERVRSLVLVNTGDGKGKSTAAFGTLLRAVARGWKVGVVQFLKSGDWKVGEEKIGRDLGVDWWALGDGFTWDSEDIDLTRATAVEAWRSAREMITSGQHQLVILDEITYAMTWGWIDTAEVVATIRDRPDRVNVIVTGRDCPSEIVEIADTVTDRKSVV